MILVNYSKYKRLSDTIDAMDGTILLYYSRVSIDELVLTFSWELALVKWESDTKHSHYQQKDDDNDTKSSTYNENRWTLAIHCTI